MIFIVMLVYQRVRLDPKNPMIYMIYPHYCHTMAGSHSAWRGSTADGLLRSGRVPRLQYCECRGDFLLERIPVG